MGLELVKILNKEGINLILHLRKKEYIKLVSKYLKSTTADVRYIVGDLRKGTTFIKLKNSKDRLILGLLLSFLNTETNFEKRRKIRGFNTQNWPTYNMYDTISYSLGIDKILPYTKYDLENVKVKISF